MHAPLLLLAILVALSFLLHPNSGKIANLHLGNSCDVSQKSSQGSKLAFNRVSLVSLYQIITVFLVQCPEKPCFNILCGKINLVMKQSSLLSCFLTFYFMFDLFFMFLTWKRRYWCSFFPNTWFQNYTFPSK